MCVDMEYMRETEKLRVHQVLSVGIHHHSCLSLFALYSRGRELHF